MPRPKREFKILCTLPAGTWQIIQHKDGALLLVSQNHGAKSLDLKKGKVTDLIKEPNDAKGL
jgi:hypothetical protein